MFGLLFSLSLQAEQLDATLGWAEGARYNFMVTGEVDQVLAASGARVEKGKPLVRLYQRPFQLQVKQAKAEMETIEPLLFDAKIDLSQAEELYDRTVLSQIELQKIEAKYRGLEAQNRKNQAAYDLARMKQQKSTLVAPFDALVIDNQFIKGQMISRENQSAVSIVLAPAGRMAARFSISARQRAQLRVGQTLQVEVDGSNYAATLGQIRPAPDSDSTYLAEAVFSHSAEQILYPGQAAKITLP